MGQEQVESSFQERELRWNAWCLSVFHRTYNSLGSRAVGAEEEGQVTETVMVSDVRENPVALRTVDRDSEGYQGLVKMLTKDFDSLPPISVRKKFCDYTNVDYLEIIDGLYRYQATKDAGLTTIKVEILDIDDDEVLAMQITCNGDCGYQKTTNYEYANHFKRILTRDISLTISQLAMKIHNWSPMRIKNLLMPNLTSSVNVLVFSGKITVANAYSLAKLPQSEQPNWIHRAQQMSPLDFVPLVTTHLRRISKNWKKDEEGERVPHDDPIVVRQGWDNVTHKSQGAYVRGDILVHKKKKHWRIKHPFLDISNKFEYAGDAMRVVEEWIDGGS